jgi:coenzyme F420 hydrogenase subunit beta
VCPGYETSHNGFEQNPALIPELQHGWGPVLEIWEGHPTDPEIHYHGSSAGLATVLALYCLEKENMYGVLHIGSAPQTPWQNKTVLSRTRAELLVRTGSRYAPASPCDGLHQIELAPAPCVFIGKPCDVTGLRMSQALKPELDKKVGAAIGIFCAGTPATQGTLDLFESLNIDPAEVAEARYRGKGWPGMFAVRRKGEEFPSHQVTYKESWGFLQRYRPWRCHLCPDGTSEFADISCGDPWYREIQEGEIGSSLVVVRTERGRKIVHGAIAASYVRLRRVDPQKLEDSQKNLLAKRSAIWGRVTAMKAFGLPTPRFSGFSLFKNWCRLPFKEKLRSTFGTARRIVMRKYYKPAKF